MTREEFINVLDNEGYSYKIERDKIIVTHEGEVDLEYLTSLPPGVEFRNRGRVYLDRLTSLPPGVVFNNGGYVSLDRLTSLHPGVEFNNRRNVGFISLIGEWFYHWEGNIDDIDSTRLLNFMISKGMFI